MPSTSPAPLLPLAVQAAPRRWAALCAVCALLGLALGFAAAMVTAPATIAHPLKGPSFGITRATASGPAAQAVAVGLVALATVAHPAAAGDTFATRDLITQWGTISEPVPSSQWVTPDGERLSWADRVRTKLPQPRTDVSRTPQDPNKRANPQVFYIMAGVFSIGLGAIAFGGNSFREQQSEAETNWLSADRASLYFRIGGDALIQPASWVFEDIIIANRTAREIFEGIPRARSRKLQNDFIVTVLGGPSDPSEVKQYLSDKFCDDPEYDALVSCMVKALQDLEVPDSLVRESAAQAERKREELLPRRAPPRRPRA